MRAGTLRNRVVIQKKDDAASRINGETTWNDYATAWARIEPVTGRQTSDSNMMKTDSEVTHRITIRFLRGLTPDMRISFDGRIFKIEVILNIDERNRELEIQAIEETDI